MRVIHARLFLFSICCIALPTLSIAEPSVNELIITQTLLPLDGSLDQLPNSTHPFQGSLAYTSPMGIASRILLRPLRDTKNGSYSYVVHYKQIDYVEMTSRFILLGLSSRDENSTLIDRTIQILGCKAMSEFGTFCRELKLVQEIALDSISVLSTPLLDPSATQVPQNYFSISPDSKLMMLLSNMSAICVYMLKDGGDLETPFIRTQVLLAPKIPNFPDQKYWGIAVPRDPAVYGQATVLIAEDEAIYDNNWSGALLAWDEDTHLWQLTHKEPLTTETSQSPVVSSKLIMVTDRIAAACVQHRSEVVASFWEVRESGWTLSHLDLNTHDCQRSLMTAIPCKTITSILGLVGPETYEYTMRNQSMCLLYNQIDSATARYAADNPDVRVATSITVATRALEGRLKDRYRLIIPNARQSVDTTVDSFVVQSDAIVFFAKNTLQGILHTTRPGFESNSSGLFEVGCQPGFFKPIDDMSPCLPCPAGTHQPDNSGISCLKCSDSQYCPAGTSVPRLKAAVGQYGSSNFRFPIAASQASVQQRMISAVFNPLSLSNSASTDSRAQFLTLLATTTIGLFIIFLFYLLRRTGRAKRPVDLFLRFDLFSEPFFDERKKKIVKRGSLIGLFFTTFGALSLIMCLWFAITFYNTYVPFLVVDSGGVAAASENQSIGLNNDNTIRVVTYEGGSIHDEQLTQDLLKNLQVSVSIRLSDVRRLSEGMQLCELRNFLTNISGCLTAAGEVCSAESDNESRFGTLTSDGDCIWTIHIEGSKTISEAYSIDTYLNGIPYFTSVEASLALTSTAEAIAIAPFKLFHGFEASTTNSEVISEFMVIPVSSTVVLRNTKLNPNEDHVRQGYISATASALHTTQVISLANWFTNTPSKTSISFKVATTPFWLVQTSAHAASITDMFVVLFLTAVALFSALRIAVKVVAKIEQKAGKYYRRFRGKPKRLDLNSLGDMNEQEDNNEVTDTALSERAQLL